MASRRRECIRCPDLLPTLSLRKMIMVARDSFGVVAYLLAINKSVSPIAASGGIPRPTPSCNELMLVRIPHLESSAFSLV